MPIWRAFLSRMLTTALAALLVIAWTTPALAAPPTTIRVGVLANKGVERCRLEWTPTMRYLDQRLRQYSFSLVPLEFGAIAQAVQESQVDFVLANSSIYVELENYFGVSRMITLKTPASSGASSLFGGVIFCRADRQDIKTIQDLKGKTFMAVDFQSLGGWRMAWREFKDAGINPYHDFKQLSFAGYHDNVAMAVLNGEVDAGTVRTDILERMQKQGRLKLDDFRIIQPRSSPLLPLVHSTRLYPEWPLARVSHTSAELAEQVVIALLSMSADDPAAQAAGYVGWTIPENYTTVRELLRELRLGPYQDLGKITLGDIIQRWWPLILVSALLFISMAAFAGVVLRLNRRLRAAHGQTLLEMESRRQAEEERQRLLEELQAALANVKNLSGLLPICASCKKIRNDSGDWEPVEGYIAKKSQAQFSHGICPECAAKLYPELVGKK